MPTEIDKGAGKKIGYYPDYIIYIGGLPLLVVEAKDPSTPAETGYREARLYALELNKKYPEGINPIRSILACNGTEVIFGVWDDENQIKKINVVDMVPGSAVLNDIVTEIGRLILYKRSQELRAKLFPSKQYKPLLMLGGPSRQNETIPPNSFAAELVPLLRRYFDPDETAHSAEVIERGYCSSDEITKYNATLEALLKDRIPDDDSFSSIKTSRHKAEQLNDALRSALDDKSSVPDPFIMLVGSVGAGKSMFIERYLGYLADDRIKKNTRWSVINFNKAPDSLTNIEQWICEAFISDFTTRLAEPEPLSYDNLLRYFAPDISKRKNGPYKVLVNNDPIEYERRIANDLTEWTDNPVKLASGIIRYYAKDKAQPVVVVFDNVDKRDRDQQLRIFQIVQWFRHNNKCFTLLALRDETYEAHKNEPPLDAFLKPFAFRITAPRFINVVRKRLELSLEHLTKSADSIQEYTLDNGMIVKYPSSKIGKYLMTIYLSVFHPQRSIRLILEALSGRNIRRALEMFTEILMSGYLTENFIFSLTEGESRTIPEWLIIRVLMRTHYKYFSDHHGYVLNVFGSLENSKSSNCFLIINILEYLAVNRKKKTSFKLEGYHLVQDVLIEMGKYGYGKEDCMWAIEACTDKELIIADHQRAHGITISDYIKITASGFYHARFLAKREEYLANAIIDTFLSDRAVASDTVNQSSDIRAHIRKRLELLKLYLNYEVDRLCEFYPAYCEDNSASKHQIQFVAEALSLSRSAPRDRNQDDLFD